MTHMTTRMIFAALLASASAAFAQTSGGGRRGGPPPGPMCLDPSHVESIQILKGAAAIATYGPDAKNGIVIIIPKGGLPVSNNVFGPCAAPTTDQAEDPFNANLFAPSWVMSHDREIGLSDDQKKFIQDQMVLARTKFALTETKLRGEMENLNGLLAAKPVNESTVLDAVDRVLALERDIKRAQVSLMVSVKNKLTEQQTARLEQLRKGDDD